MLRKAAQRPRTLDAACARAAHSPACRSGTPPARAARTVCRPRTPSASMSASITYRVLIKEQDLHALHLLEHALHVRGDRLPHVHRRQAVGARGDRPRSEGPRWTTPRKAYVVRYELGISQEKGLPTLPVLYRSRMDTAEAHVPAIMRKPAIPIMRRATRVPRRFRQWLQQSNW